MNHLFRNKFFIYSVTLVGLQQLAIGSSTYYIGLAGQAIVHSSAIALEYITLFFTFVALAYLLGSCSLFLQTKLSNSCWDYYYKKIFQELGSDIHLATRDNKITTQNWISGESFQTFQEASHTFVDAVSVFLNIVFTIIAFTLVLGMQISLVVFLSLLLAVLSMRLAKPFIHKLSNQIQAQKIVTLNAIHQIWDNLFFGNQHYAQLAQQGAEKPIEQLFASIQRYKMVEQLFSCMPIFIVIPIIIMVVRQQVSSYAISPGVLVAVLPRSLQLLQNIHALCSSLSNILLLHNKISNLYRFVDRLPKRPLTSERTPQAIVIDCLKGPTNQVWTSEILLDHLMHSGLPQGRFLITGGNGSGKSSLLRRIKQKYPEAILWGPDIVLGIEKIQGSVGEQHLYILLEILQNSKNSLLLLDEWDAALDQFNTKSIDQQLNQLARVKTILEVRHKHVQVP